MRAAAVPAAPAVDATPAEEVDEEYDDDFEDADIESPSKVHEHSRAACMQTRMQCGACAHRIWLMCVCVCARARSRVVAAGGSRVG
jgi:hypothetical protein